MSTLTPTISLIKPDPSAVGDYANIDDINTNSDRIDAAYQSDHLRLLNLESSLLNKPWLTNPVFKRKTAASNVINSTAYVADPDLVFTMAANVEYQVDVNLKTSNQNGQGGFNFAFFFPAVAFAECFVVGGGGVSSSAASALTLTSGGLAAGIAQAVSGVGVEMDFTVFIKPTAGGTFQLYFAQQVANMTQASFLNPGSTLLARVLA